MTTGWIWSNRRRIDPTAIENGAHGRLIWYERMLSPLFFFAYLKSQKRDLEEVFSRGRRRLIIVRFDLLFRRSRREVGSANLASLRNRIYSKS